MTPRGKKILEQAGYTGKKNNTLPASKIFARAVNLINIPEIWNDLSEENHFCLVGDYPS